MSSAMSHRSRERVMKKGGVLVLVLLCAPVVRAQGPEPIAPPGGKLIKDQWDAAYLDGHRAGYVRLKVEELPGTAGQKTMRVTQEMDLRVRRGSDIARIPVLTVHVGIDHEEDVTINTVGGAQRLKLLRVTMVPDEIEGVQLPSQIVWYDSDFEIRKSLSNLPGVGFLATERSTAAYAQQP